MQGLRVTVCLITTVVSCSSSHAINMSGFGGWDMFVFFFLFLTKQLSRKKKKCGINRTYNEIGLSLKLINLELTDAVNPTGNR